ncbi:hypothetical protein [Paenibacillus sp. GCM10027626]|uniref:hypothetical protein n=1 Tax=Paenibacillus sp. GCM10027626 TaxID=3273411 RepID=UPI0036425F3D
MKKRAHKTSALLAFILILSFQISTVVFEALGDHDIIATVKRLILYGFFVLIPLLLIAEISGRSLAGGAEHPLILKKKQRMRLIGINAIIILIPSAVVLYLWSNAGYWGNWFVTVQVLEIMSGITIVSLMGLNIRDGIKLRTLRSKA